MKRGARHSAETRKQMSAAWRKAFADPVFRKRWTARLSEAARKIAADPEVRKRRSVARKKAWAGCAADVVVPPWVPADLVDEFIEMAGLADEFAAADHVRRLLRELRSAA